jgi:hypothetical protein
MNERFQTHSHSLCVSHSNLDLTIRNRIMKRNRMSVLGKYTRSRLFEKYDASYFVYESFRKDWEISTLECTLSFCFLFTRYSSTAQTNLSDDF